MSLNSHALGLILKEELGFDGFIISDYDEVGKYYYIIKIRNYLKFY
jgi:beta-glucosidase-like glycosyl hydrolase